MKNYHLLVSSCLLFFIIAYSSCSITGYNYYQNLNAETAQWVWNQKEGCSRYIVNSDTVSITYCIPERGYFADRIVTYGPLLLPIIPGFINIPWANEGYKAQRKIIIKVDLNIAGSYSINLDSISVLVNDKLELLPIMVADTFIRNPKLKRTDARKLELSNFHCCYLYVDYKLTKTDKVAIKIHDFKIEGNNISMPPIVIDSKVKFIFNPLIIGS